MKRSIAPEMTPPGMVLLATLAGGCATTPTNQPIAISAPNPQTIVLPAPTIGRHGPADPRFWICGVWEGKGPDGSDWVFVFGPNGAADLIKNGLGYGKDRQNNDPFVLGYSFDFRTKPAQIDYHVAHQSGRKTVWRGIAEMTGPATMRIRLRNDGSRPTSFDDTASGATRTLTRVHDWSNLVDPASIL